MTTTPTPPTDNLAAEGGLRSDMSEQAKTRCTICRAPVQIINYALGPELMHYDPAASFPTESKGSAWRYCRTTMATLGGDS